MIRNPFSGYFFCLIYETIRSPTYLRLCHVHELHGVYSPRIQLDRLPKIRDLGFGEKP